MIAPSLQLQPLAEFASGELIALIERVAPKKVLSRVAKSADHFAKAAKLDGVDDEMGAIRLIAAEEELVVAIFEWLKLNAEHYPELDAFVRRYKNHRVKLAFYPVLSQFRFILADLFRDGFTVDDLDTLHWHAQPAVEEDRVVLIIRDGEKEILRHAPLSVAISHNDDSHEQIIEALHADFTRLVQEQQGMTLREFVTARASYRDKLLYAEDGGYVEMGEPLSELLPLIKESAVYMLWTLAILLTSKPPSKQWGLVSQVIALYTRVLDECRV